MAGNDEFIRLMAAWALVHETADEGWKAAVSRGEAAGAPSMDSGSEAFVDGLSALIAAEKERLKAHLAEGAEVSRQADASEGIAELRFEVAELRGMIESMQASLDAMARAKGE